MSTTRSTGTEIFWGLIIFVALTLFMIFLVLKLLHLASFGWFWVFAPITFPLGAFVGLVLLLLPFEIYEHRRKKTGSPNDGVQ